MPMDLHMSKCELAQTATVSHKGTLGLFPPGKKKRQRFVVGDDGGVVSCFEMKRGEAQEVFTYMTASGEPIQTLTLNVSEKRRDRVFASQGESIFAVSKKGEEKFRLVSPSTEAVHHMVVDELLIYTGSEFIFQLYADGKDAGFVLCHDRITALAVLPVDASGRPGDSVLACSDRLLRVVRPRPAGSVGADLHLEHRLASQITALAPYGPRTAAGARLALGTNGGGLGLVTVHEDMVERLVETENMAGGRSGVSSVVVADLTGDGVDELVVARDDGRVQVVRIDEGAGGPSLRPVFEGGVGEAVRGLACGQVSAAGFDEVICLTYSGRVLSFTTEPLDARDGEDTRGRTVRQTRAEASLKALTDELALLEVKVAAEQEKLSKIMAAPQPSLAATGSQWAPETGSGRGGASVGLATMPPSQRFEVASRLVLDRDAAAYTLELEVPRALNQLTLSSTVRLDLLHPAAAASSDAANAIVGHSVPPPGSPHAVLATYRFPEPCNRAEIRFRTNEGEAGEVVVGVVAALHGSVPVCQLLRFQVKPLSLHHRVHELPSAIDVARAQALEATRRPAALGDQAEVKGAEAGEDDEFGGGGGGGSGSGGGGGGSGSGIERLEDVNQSGGSLLSVAAAEREKRWTVLEVRGAFGVRMIHDWVSACLPEVPPRVTEETTTLLYVNAFTGAELSVTYGAGRATVKSDSVSAVAIIKEVVLERSTDLRVHVDVNGLTPSLSGCRHLLAALDPKLRHQLELAARADLVQPLTELVKSEAPPDAVAAAAGSSPGAALSAAAAACGWLSPELRAVLKDGERLAAEVRDRPRALQYLSGVLTDLFVDWHRCNGVDERHRIPHLHHFLVTEYSLEGLFNHFGVA